MSDTEPVQHGTVAGGDPAAGADYPLLPMAAALHEYAVFTLDPKGTVTSWNPGAERIMGYGADEIVGRHFSVFYPPQQVDAESPERILEKAAEDGSCTDEGWRTRKDGTWFWAHVVVTALRTSSGKLRGFAKVTRDDTESRARLDRSMQRFTDLFGLSPVGVGLFDRSGHVIDANTALCELLDYSQDELRGLPENELLHPDDPSERLLPEPASDSSAESRRVPQRVLTRRSGGQVYCDLHATRSLNDSGELFWLVVFQDVTERHRQAEQLRHRATHDELTGLPNRAAIRELFNGDPERTAVLYCDIKNFKRINDSLGHSAGDELLLTLARRLTTGIPEGWSVARVSGDEYLVVCPDVYAAGGIDSVIAVVSGLLRTTVPVRGQLIRVSAWIGAAVPEHSGTSGEDLMRFASAAALEAKNSGPEHTALAGPALTASVDRQLQLEEQLREAIDADQLSLRYQPIVGLDGTVLGAESLVRWPHPQRGLLTPDVFLPVAEQGELLRDLDRWVLRTALREAATWPAPTGRPVTVGVNMSALVPGDPEFVRIVTDLVTESGVPWKRLVMELVETVLCDLPLRPRQDMSELVEQGMWFAVDDFGVGYSSLARLKDLPVQLLKIDRRFVSGIESDPSDLAVVRAIADMARAMQRNCVAEGVETTGQLNMLRSIGVDVYQGWLFSPALSAPDLRNLLESGPLYPTRHG